MKASSLKTQLEWAINRYGDREMKFISTVNGGSFEDTVYNLNITTNALEEEGFSLIGSGGKELKYENFIKLNWIGVLLKRFIILKKADKIIIDIDSVGMLPLGITNYHGTFKYKGWEGSVKFDSIKRLYIGVGEINIKTLSNHYQHETKGDYIYTVHKIYYEANTLGELKSEFVKKCKSYNKKLGKFNLK